MREMFNFRYYVLAFLVWAAMVGWLSDAPEYMDNVDLFSLNSIISKNFV